MTSFSLCPSSFARLLNLTLGSSVFFIKSSFCSSVKRLLLKTSSIALNSPRRVSTMVNWFKLSSVKHVLFKHNLPSNDTIFTDSFFEKDKILKKECDRPLLYLFLSQYKVGSEWWLLSYLFQVIYISFRIFPEYFPCAACMFFTMYVYT